MLYNSATSGAHNVEVLDDPRACREAEQHDVEQNNDGTTTMGYHEVPQESVGGRGNIFTSVLQGIEAL